jgi:hypothetical protein
VGPLYKIHTNKTVRNLLIQYNCSSVSNIFQPITLPYNMSSEYSAKKKTDVEEMYLTHLSAILVPIQTAKFHKQQGGKLFHISHTINTLTKGISQPFCSELCTYVSLA